MYEKYSGLPDTTKPAPSGGSRPTERSAREGGYSGGNGTIEYYQAPRSSGSSSSKRASARRAKARKRKMIIGLVSLFFLALIIVAVVLLAKGCSEPVVANPATDHFRNGVYINWTDVSGKTVDEVRPLLESNETNTLNNISITLASDQINAVISGADMKASSNLNEVIQQALSGGSNQEYYSKITIDDAALASRIEEINATSSTPPTDASVTFDFSSSGKPTPQYIEGKAGYGLDVQATTTLVKQTLESGQMQAALTPTLTTVEPTITTADVQAHTTLIGSYKTTYDFKGTAEDTDDQRATIPLRAFNVEKASAAINNQVIKPGKSWSFNDVVGDRNEANGWELANGIFGGDKLTKQYGGGVCQVSTTLYNALLEAYPYFKFDRQSHSIPSTYVDMGLDATVDTGHIDFAFTNQSEYPVYIFSYCTENKMAKSRKRDIYVLIYGEALPAGTEYKPRTVTVSEEAPGEDIITETSKLFVGEEKILAEPRSKYIVDVYVDRYVDGEKQEEIFMYEDTYPGNPLRKQVGTKATPTPVLDTTPAPEITEGP